MTLDNLVSDISMEEHETLENLVNNVGLEPLLTYLLYNVDNTTKFLGKNKKIELSKLNRYLILDMFDMKDLVTHLKESSEESLEDAEY